MRVLVNHIGGGQPNLGHMATWVKKDVDILAEQHEVSAFFYRSRRDIIPLLWAVARSDMVISWFVWDNAYYAGLFSKMLGKRCIAIVGGFEVTNISSIEYGGAREEKSRTRLGRALGWSDRVLAVSEFTKKETLEIVQADIEVLYHGFDSTVFRPSDKPKKMMAITVGAVSRSNLKRKGLETFVQAASFLPDVPFVVVGKFLDDSVNELKRVASQNVRFTGFLSDIDLLGLLQEAKVYVQVSLHEGFGCSVAEAMLCECVPVVTRIGGLPEVVGEIGYYVRCNDPEGTAEAIREALENDTLGPSARARIIENFSLDRRKERLQSLVTELLG